jgi:hypothetical protein
MFKMAFRVVYRIKGRCSRHPAYNPVKDEQEDWMHSSLLDISQPRQGSLWWIPCSMR